MIKKKLIAMAAFMLMASFTACSDSQSKDTASQEVSQAPLAAPDESVKEPDTITIAWLPNNSGDNQKEFRGEFARIISEATGKNVENKLTTDYNIAVAALESGDAQLGYFGPFEYLTSHKKDPKVIPLVVESGKSGTLSDSLYYSRLLVKKGDENDYKAGTGFSLDNIEGKRVSFVSASSTSGFNMPASVIIDHFSKQDKWKDFKKDGLMQGGSGKFFSQVIFSGSHQLSLINLLNGKADIAAVNDVDVIQYADLSEGEDNKEGAVYTVKKDADAPFNNLAGKQYVIIKSIPVQNTPLEANSAFLSRKTMDAITQALISDQTTSNSKIFMEKGTKGCLFVKPHRFLKVEDSWYDPMRKDLGF